MNGFLNEEAWVRQQADRASPEPHARMYWKDGRAYIDARSWARWGGKLQALIPSGDRTATKDLVQAALLFAQRLTELRKLRVEYPAGLPAQSEVAQQNTGDPLDRIATFAGWYLAEKELRPGRKRVTKRHLRGQRQKLVYAALLCREARKGVAP